MLIESQHIVVHAGSRITATFDGKPHQFRLEEDIVVWADGQKNMQVSKLGYDPSVGDDKICNCGHPYHMHFEVYSPSSAIECRHCGCLEFIYNEEATKRFYTKSSGIEKLRTFFDKTINANQFIQSPMEPELFIEPPKPKRRNRKPR